MTVQIDLPEEVLQALGPEPAREVYESVLLSLIQQNKMTIVKAGSLLGMDRLEAIHWYVSKGFYYPDLGEDDLLNELEHAKLS